MVDTIEIVERRIQMVFSIVDHPFDPMKALKDVALIAMCDDATIKRVDGDFSYLKSLVNGC